MSYQKEKLLKLKLEEARSKNFKIMWAHANWEWRIIIIIGCVASAYYTLRLGAYIGNLIG